MKTYTIVYSQNNLKVEIHIKRTKIAQITTIHFNNNCDVERTELMLWLTTHRLKKCVITFIIYKK